LSGKFAEQQNAADCRFGGFKMDRQSSAAADFWRFVAKP